MNTRKSFRDYPLSFWFAVLATITAAFLAISSYSRMINDDVATMKAAMIVISFEGALIVAMATMSGRLQGLLKGWAFIMLLMLALAEIFMASMEIQHGIAAAGANAVNYQQSATNLGTVAGGMADATKALSDCDKRYPRKKRDAEARATCRKPYEAIAAASMGAMPTIGNAPKYDEENAGKLAQWQSVADALNTTWKPETPITWAQAAFYVMTLIMALFILVKNFLWAKYAHEGELKSYLASDPAPGYVVMPEQRIGQPQHDNDEEEDGEAPSLPTSAPTSALRRAGEAIATEMMRAQHARNSVNDRTAEALGKVGDMLDKATVRESDGFRQSPAQRANAQRLANGDGMPTGHGNTGHGNTGHGKGDGMPTGHGNTGHGKGDGMPTGHGNTVGKSDAHREALEAPTGSIIGCLNCGKQITKRNPQHVYCSNDRKPREDGGNCADDYKNAQDPQRMAAIRGRKRKG